MLYVLYYVVLYCIVLWLISAMILICFFHILIVQMSKCIYVIDLNALQQFNPSRHR